MSNPTKLSGIQLLAFAVLKPQTRPAVNRELDRRANTAKSSRKAA